MRRYCAPPLAITVLSAIACKAPSTGIEYRTVKQKPAYIVTLEAYPGNQYFSISIKNKSEQDIVVNWSRCQFIQNGGTDGTFTFGTEQYWDEGEQTIPPTTVISGGTIERNLYPKTLRYWAKNNPIPWVRRTWFWKTIDASQVGAIISISCEGQEHAERFLWDVK